MEFSTVLIAFTEMCALFGPFLPPIMGLYWLDKVVRLWAPWSVQYRTDEIIWELFGGVVMMCLAIDYSVGVIRAPASGVQVFVVIVTGVCILILLDRIYQRVRAFIRPRRTSS